MKNQFRGMSDYLLNFFSEHAVERMKELIERNAPAEMIDRLDQDMTDIYYAMNAKK